jgi:diguanylate cyclase (GGDEF)-like protein
MISLKKYLDSTANPASVTPAAGRALLSTAIDEYVATLEVIGNCCLEACPVTGEPLKRELGDVRTGLNCKMEANALAAAGDSAQKQLNGWGRATAKHYHDKANEVKELLLAMARTAEGVSARDERCAGQMNDVTNRLRTIATLEDLTEIRVSIEKSAGDLKASIERMTVEGKAALDDLRAQVAAYQTKLDEAEAIASRDALTALSSRLYVEAQVEKRIAGGANFCVVLIDIDGFKRVNDEHGHVTGDELLKKFAAELRSACHATDVIGRWGGDEFLLLFDSGIADAKQRVERLRKWICGSYAVRGSQGELKLQVEASIGLAEHSGSETMNQLVGRADAEMYAVKELARRKRLETKLAVM